MIKYKLIPALLLITLCILTFTSKAKAQALVDKPIFSTPAGFYDSEFDLTITAGNDETIYYTIDGSNPVVDNEVTSLYTTPIQIKYDALREEPSYFFCGTVIKAIAVDKEGNTSKPSTASYFVDKDIMNRYQMPVISITTDNSNLNDNITGIMVHRNVQKRGKEWERPIHLEFFDKEGNLILSQGAGIRLHGAASRGWAFKSFRLYARSEYDEDFSQFKYDFFSDSVIPALVMNTADKGQPITKFKRLILRAGGNEGTAGDGTLIRDSLSQALMTNTTLDLQAYLPSATFINGEFYGIQNIRERQDDKYIEDHYNIDENDVVIYEFSYERGTGKQIPQITEGIESDLDFYITLRDFIADNDLSITENYEQIQKWLDIENFVDYQIINIFGANRDWPGNNCKAWRARKEYDPEAEHGLDGRIRWLLYDCDFNFGLYNLNTVNMNALEDAVEEGRISYPNEDGATMFLRKLLENEEFKIYFCQRFLDLINTNFDKDYSNELIDKMAEKYVTAIDEQKTRYFLLHDWEKNIKNVKGFIEKRASVCKNHLSAKFNLGETFFLNIAIENNNQIGGKVQVNTVIIDSTTNGMSDGVWRKSYYDELSTLVEAIPNEGYKFVSWSGDTDDTSPTLDVKQIYDGGGEITLTPIFNPITQSKSEDEIQTDKNSQDGINNSDESIVSEDDLVDSTNQTKKTSDKVLYIIFLIILIIFIAILSVYYLLHKRKRNK